ncbi:DUF6261 family protein [Draconibacterium halophilum]|uniref:Uncharacterized protein n=1 Tax=Draconibacterium halophilum TaxID=2706887 RepID=A0A6C0RDY7_9BACT|nr:DUF6261 family protein [Draconibacterium halophilum]QIA08754.1 hypothetical protein G0Q07_13945 [Draconibacterium halophilum]
MILTFNLSGLTNAELLSFAQSLDALLEPLGETISVIYDPFKHALVVCVETSASAIAKQVAQQQTEALGAADLKRDNVFRGVKYITQAYLLHPDAKKQEAAQEVEKVIAKVGWHLNREGYDEQSALMKTLLKELTGKQAAHVALLGMTEYVDLLNTSQTEFDVLRQEQLDHNTEMEQVSSMTAVRGDLEQTIKDLLEILPGFYRMTNNETLGVVLPKIKELIDRTV